MVWLCHFKPKDFSYFICFCITVNRVLLGFRLLVGGNKNKTSEDVNLGFEKHAWIFLFFVVFGVFFTALTAEFNCVGRRCKNDTGGSLKIVISVRVVNASAMKQRSGPGECSDTRRAGRGRY